MSEKGDCNTNTNLPNLEQFALSQHTQVSLFLPSFPGQLFQLNKTSIALSFSLKAPNSEALHTAKKTEVRAPSGAMLGKVHDDIKKINPARK